MNKGKTKRAMKSQNDEDTMRPEYDFSKAVRGVTSERYKRGTNVIVLEPDVARMFPDAAAVNEALRSLGEISSRIEKRKRITKHRASA